MQITIRALVANGSLLEETYTIAENYIAHCEGGSRYSIDKVEDGAINLVDVYGRTEATLEEPLFKIGRNEFVGQSTDCTYYKFNLVFATKALYQNELGGKTYPIWFVGDDRIVVGETQYSVCWSSYGNLQLMDSKNDSILLEGQPFLYDGTDLHFLDVTGKRWAGYPKVAQHLTPYSTEDSKCIKISSTNGEYLIFEVGQEYSAIVDEGESVIVGKVARSQENILQIVEDEGRTIVIEKPIKMIDDGEYIAEDVYGRKIVLEAV